MRKEALQAPRVAKARRLPQSEVEDLVRKHTEGRDLGFLGEPRVNVLLLNLDLDRSQGFRVQGSGFRVQSERRTPGRFLLNPEP